MKNVILHRNIISGIFLIFFNAIVSPAHNYVAVSFFFFVLLFLLAFLLLILLLPVLQPFFLHPLPPFLFFLLLFLLFLLSLHSSPSPFSSSSLFLWFLLKCYHINEDNFLSKIYFVIFI